MTQADSAGSSPPPIPYRDGRFVGEVREGKRPHFPMVSGWLGVPGFEPGNGGIKSILISVPRSSRWVAKLWRNECQRHGEMAVVRRGFAVQCGGGVIK